MKNNTMKYILPLAIFVIFSSCSDNEFVDYGDNGIQKIADPFLQINTPVVSFQSGIPDYTYDFNVINGERKLTKLNVYSQFTDAKSGVKSDKILFKTYTVGADNKQNITETVSYNDLKSGISVNGNALPDSDTEVPIGSGWVLDIEGETAQGNLNLGNIKIAVLSAYAGLYKVLESSYFRIGVASISWTGETRFIGSVDETTFAHNDYWGPFAWTGNSFNFKIDLTDNSIDVPILVGGALFSGNRATSCETEPDNLKNVPCATSNILIPDPDNPKGSNGKHIIKLTYGYFTDNSGPREFYEVLEKI